MIEPSVESTCRVFIVDDGSIVCFGLRAVLSGNSTIEVVGREEDNWRALETVRRMAPDVVIMTLAQGGLLPLIRQVRKLVGESVAVLVVGGSEALAAKSLVAGASGTISWHANAVDVTQAVLTARSRNSESRSPRDARPSWSPHIAARRTVRLSDREMEVMRRATEGLTNSGIARSLSLSEATVKTYWRRIFRKLDAHDRTVAIITAMNLGVLPPRHQRIPRYRRTVSSACGNTGE